MLERPPDGHWADEIAARLADRSARHVISTGISPSGEIHVGNLREMLTADAVRRALRERGVEARLNFVADELDPLRHVYPFLDPAVYAPLVGRPLSRIRCPCARHPSYADHFLEPFLASLDTLRVEPEVERADAVYRSGRMTPLIVLALEGRARIAAILRELTGKEVGDAWSPFTPICGGCGRMTSATVRGFSVAAASVDYECACGTRGTVPMAGGGKLVWRVDWPARWKLFGVTIEPFGKDHATRGGSYDTGVRIVREVFGGEPPDAVPYEWIRLRGRGDMSSSRGNVLSIARMLEVVPPDVLRYLVLRERPQRTIEFDPGLPLLQLVDEMDDAASARRDDRALALSRAGEFRPTGVPFKHLVVVAQAAGFDPERIREILARTGYAQAPAEAVRGRVEYARRWLDGFAPDDLRFQVCQALPAEAAELSAGQRTFLARLAERLREGMDGPAVHAAVYELAGELAPLPPAELFRAIYLALLGKPRGPRAGWFIAILGPGFCARRFQEAAGPRS